MKLKLVNVYIGKIACLSSAFALAGCAVLAPAEEDAAPAVRQVAPAVPATPKKVYTPPGGDGGDGGDRKSVV